MPRLNVSSHQKQQMSSNYKDNQEARILQAIEAIHINKSLSIHAAARIYDVPYTTLVRCLR